MVTFVQGDAFTFAPDAPVAWAVSDVIAFPERCLELLDRWCGQEWAQRLVFTMKFKGAEPDFDSIDAAIEFVNARPKPLALYVFTESSDVADRLVGSTSSGGAVVNHVMIQKTPALPFGGVGPSGTGRYHGRSGFDEYSNLKTVLRKPTKPDVSLIYPPYTRTKERILRRFL